MSYRVIQWATGGVGRAAMEGVLAHPDLELAGAWVHSPEKEGVDLGSLVGRHPLGVAATGDVEALLATEADCVLYSPIFADPAMVAAILESGKNVVSPLGWFYPPPEEREQFDAVARKAGVTLHEFCTVAEGLSARGVIGRFSTFLEHVKPSASGVRVTRYNALFHWRVPEGREIEAGREVGRHHILTHAYWREGGPEFANVNVMAVAHGTDKATVLAHKAAIDAHLAEAGIPVSYTNVFWGGRSEIKPSEISPLAYEAWCRAEGIDPTPHCTTGP